METVTENQVLTEEELQTLKTIQEETQALIAELGEIELIKIQLENRRKIFPHFWAKKISSGDFSEKCLLKKETLNQNLNKIPR